LAQVSFRVVANEYTFFFYPQNYLNCLIIILNVVEALKDIGETLGKKDWDFSVDPCSGEHNWTSHTKVRGTENNVTCDCSFENATICHVTNMYFSHSLYFFKVSIYCCH